jgi:hypothetical protein
MVIHHYKRGPTVLCDELLIRAAFIPANVLGPPLWTSPWPVVSTNTVARHRRIWSRRHRNHPSLVSDVSAPFWSIGVAPHLLLNFLALSEPFSFVATHQNLEAFIKKRCATAVHHLTAATRHRWALASTTLPGASPNHPGAHSSGEDTPELVSRHCSHLYLFRNPLFFKYSKKSFKILKLVENGIKLRQM